LNEFAKSVAYYEYDGSTNPDGSQNNNLRQSNWQNFFKASGSVQVSLIEAFDATGFETAFLQRQQNYTEGLTRDQVAPIFDFLFETALMINGWHAALASDEVLLDNQIFRNESPLQRTIADLVRSNLRPSLIQLISIANIFETANPSYHAPDLTELFGEDKPFGELDFAERYQKDTLLLNLRNNPLAFEQTFRERLDTIFRTFAKAIRQIVADASSQNILPATGTHQPHLTLLYTFLRLFDYLNDDLNRLPQKHLDWYYRQILGLQPKPLIPDKAHIVFELPKNTPPQYKVEKNTLLKDGKDAKGADVLFGLDEELVVSKTQVAELRTIYHNIANQPSDLIYALPKANSEDGLGLPFPKDSLPQWATLGKTNNAAIANIGFILTSTVLLLEAGERTVTLTFDVAAGDISRLKDKLQVELSGKKGWFVPTTGLDYSELGSNKIKFKLGIKEEAIAAVDPSVLGVDLGIKDVAALRITVLKNQFNDYKNLKNLKINSISIQATVAGLQNVQVRTDEGDQDPTKPFMPFGAVPSVGSAFSIGSKEIFAKKLDSISVNYEWDKKPNLNGYYAGYNQTLGITVPASEVDFGRKIYLYENGKFQKRSTDDGLFTTPTSTTALTFTKTEFRNLQIGEIPPSVSNAQEVAWQDGFITIQLQHDFLHRFYAEAMTKKALALAHSGLNNLTIKAIDDVKAAIGTISLSDNFPAIVTDATQHQTNVNTYGSAIRSTAQNKVEVLKSNVVTNPTINPPYTPIIKNLTIGYTATDTATVFRIHPFDDGRNVENITSSTDKSLLFQFEKSGALLIGLSDATIGSLVPILFQLSESSAATNLPKARVLWEYLSGNTWATLILGQNLLNDGTNGLIQSGIVDIILPPNNSKATTILPPQYYWLRVSTGDNVAAICQTLGIHTQVGQATFKPTEQNDTSRLATPLAAESIAKLEVADPNIKKISQPYPSFGGLPTEDDVHFYRRVSERLRHKGRSVTLLDYENLVLEAFPEVFKVKCIPHTFSDILADPIRNKTIRDIHAAAGFVTVVVVPNSLRTAFFDATKPTASRGLLTQIEAFLKKRISPFIRLQVLNPLYDEIKVNATVKFQTGKSPEYYAEQLKKDLSRHLAPWAFDPTAQVSFGGVVYQSSIIGFIENRDYVDYVSDFFFNPTIIPTPNVRIRPEDKTAIEAASARVVLTTGEHDITPYTPPTVRLVRQNTPSVNLALDTAIDF
jgi:hypothetical protein